MDAEGYSPVVDAAGGIVDAVVRVPSAAVLEGILDGGDAQHEDEGQHRHLFPEGIHRRHEVEQDDEQEVQIGKPRTERKEKEKRKLA